METREGHDLEVRPSPEVVAGAARTEAVHDGPPRPAARRRPFVALAALLALAVALTLLLVLLLGGDGGGEVEARTPPAAVPAGPAALGLSVQQPETVVAGSPATLQVRWTDGSGV